MTLCHTKKAEGCLYSDYIISAEDEEGCQQHSHVIIFTKDADS